MSDDPQATALAVVGQTLHDFAHQLADLRLRVAGLEALARSQVEHGALDALRQTQDKRAGADRLHMGKLPDDRS